MYYKFTINCSNKILVVVIIIINSNIQVPSLYLDNYFLFRKLLPLGRSPQPFRDNIIYHGFCGCRIRGLNHVCKLGEQKLKVTKIQNNK